MKLDGYPVTVIHYDDTLSELLSSAYSPRSVSQMDPKALLPYGLSLLDYFQGEPASQLIIRRDDEFEVTLPVSHFFRKPAEFSPIEVAALERCQGHVLDIGAGTGLHTLTLLSRGLEVTAIDICPQAVEIMTQRGVVDVIGTDFFNFQGGPFNTLLLLGHGIGFVEDFRGLTRFLVQARPLTCSGGRLFLDSLDVRRTKNPLHLAYHDANLRAKRYIGTTRIQFEYQGRTGPFCGWLHVDPHTLREHAEPLGWKCESVLEQDEGDYLACLTKKHTGNQ